MNLTSDLIKSLIVQTGKTRMLIPGMVLMTVGVTSVDTER